ncbi:hypothetical protein [Streptomyces sp. NPDC002587]
METALTILRDLALFLINQQNKNDWALADVHDVEAFLATLPKARKRRLVVLGQFFRFARTQHIVLIDPTRNMTSKSSKGFRGRTLTLDQQRHLFRRWTTDEEVHPHEAVVGMLALLHGASSSETRVLQVNDVDQRVQTVRLGKRPHPVPLSWPAGVRGDEPVGDRQGDRAGPQDGPQVPLGTGTGDASASVAERAAGSGQRVIDEFGPLIDSMLRVEVLMKAAVMHERLAQEYGFTGNYQRVKLYVQTARPRIAEKLGITPKELAGIHRRFEVIPGAQAQADWGDEDKILAHMGIAKVYSFHMT